MQNHTFTLPESLRREVSRFQDGMGRAWLDRLPALLAECVARWELTPGPPFPYPSLSYVAPVRRRDGNEAVLKVGFLADELTCEIAALTHYAGRGCVRLLASDAAQGALLLERLRPGDDLTSLPDDDAGVLAAAGVMRDLWRPPPAGHAFPSIADWGRGFAKLRARFDGGTGPLPAPLVERAEELMADLSASPAEPMLLHGDLQHFNVLRAERRPWLAIDPKGVVGDPACEVGPFLRNALRQASSPARLIARRVALFADELGIERARLRDWGLVMAMLSAWWSVEDTGDGWEQALSCAEALADIE